jgi:prephenate dehydrogenase
MRLAILGLGLIGGSILRAALDRMLAVEVKGWDDSPAVLEAAREAGFGPRVTRTLEEACVGATMCVVAVPARAVPTLVDRARRAMPPGGVVTDTAGTKGWIAGEVRRLAQLPPGPRDRQDLPPFVGGHPITGSERGGFAASSADLFDGRPWIIVAGAVGPAAAVGPADAAGPAGAVGPAARVETLVRGLGARPARASAETHDRILALTSHLPYLLAVALAESAWKERDTVAALAPFVAGGFRDSTRLALQDPVMGLDMLTTNAAELTRALAEVTAAARAAIADRPADRFRRAREFRAELGRLKQWP